jgi:hypothetical protein
VRAFGQQVDLGVLVARVLAHELETLRREMGIVAGLDRQHGQLDVASGLARVVHRLQHFAVPAGKMIEERGRHHSRHLQHA